MGYAFPERPAGEFNSTVFRIGHEVLQGVLPFYRAGRQVQRLRFHHTQSVLLRAPLCDSNRLNRLNEAPNMIAKAFQTVKSEKDRHCQSEQRLAEELVSDLTGTIIDLPVDSPSTVEIRRRVSDIWKRANAALDEEFLHELCDPTLLVPPCHEGITLDEHAMAVVEKYVIPFINELDSVLLAAASGQTKLLFILGKLIEEAICPNDVHHCLRASHVPGTWAHRALQDSLSTDTDDPEFEEERPLTMAEIANAIRRESLAAQRCEVGQLCPAANWWREAKKSLERVQTFVPRLTLDLEQLDVTRRSATRRRKEFYAFIEWLEQAVSIAIADEQPTATFGDYIIVHSTLGLRLDVNTGVLTRDGFEKPQTIRPKKTRELLKRFMQSHGARLTVRDLVPNDGKGGGGFWAKATANAEQQVSRLRTKLKLLGCWMSVGPNYQLREFRSGDDKRRGTGRKTSRT